MQPIVDLNADWVATYFTITCRLQLTLNVLKIWQHFQFHLSILVNPENLILYSSVTQVYIRVVNVYD